MNIFHEEYFMQKKTASVRYFVRQSEKRLPFQLSLLSFYASFEKFSLEVTICFVTSVILLSYKMAVDQIQQCNQKTLTKQPSKEFSVFKSVLLAHDYIKALIYERGRTLQEKLSYRRFNKAYKMLGESPYTVFI